MKLIFNLVLILAGVSAYASTGPKDNSKRSRSVERTFKVDPKSYFEITNKYGQIIVNTWQNDSIKINAEITAYGKDRDDARKLLSRVEIDFRQTGAYLTVETLLDRKSGFFKELWNNISDYSKTLLSKTKLKIDYTIYVPQTIQLEVENKFGDLYLSEIMGKCDLNISHGNLRANVIHGESYVEVGYGDVRIKRMETGRLFLKTVDADIAQLGDVTLKSSSSNIHIKEGDQITLDSKNDKLVRFGTVRRLTGESLFSKIELKDLEKSLDLNMNYGKLEAASIAFSFSKIDLEGKYTDIRLQFESNTYLRTDITAKEDGLTLPIQSTALEKAFSDDKKKHINVKGTMGEKNNYPGYLYINSTGGEVSIELQGASHSVNR